MKRCQKCKEFKDLICFYKNKLTSDGFSYQCKECVREIVAKWRRENPDRKKQTDNNYRRENKQKTKQAVKKWRIENPEKSKKTSKKWQIENPEKFAEYSRKYQRKYHQKQKQEQAANLFFQMAHFASEITKTTPPTP